MTKIKIREGLSITLPKELKKIFPITEGGDLILEVEDGRRIILSPPPKVSIVEKTSGILKGRIEEGIKFENRLRKEAGKRLKREGIK